MRIRKICLHAGMAVLSFSFISAICGHSAREEQDAPPPPQNTKVLRIILDSVIWGKNLLPAIAQAEVLQQKGEQVIELFPDAVVSGQRFDRNKQDEVNKKIERLNQAVNEADRSDFYKRLNSNKAFDKVSGKANTYPLYEGDSTAVGIIFEGNNRLFSPGTKMATVFRRLGKPEKTSTRTIHGPGEERPQILTLYSYENGIIVFAEAEIATAPGLLNRVYVDVPRLVRALRNEMK